MSTTTIKQTTEQEAGDGPLHVGTIQIPLDSTRPTANEIQYYPDESLIIPIYPGYDSRLQSQFTPAEHFAQAWDHFVMSLQCNDAAVFAAPGVDSITFESLIIDPQRYQVFDVATGKPVLVATPTNCLIAKDEAKRIIQRRGQPVIISCRFPLREWEEELPTSQQAIGQRPKGSITPHFEFIGVRPGADHAELLMYGDNRGALQDYFCEIRREGANVDLYLPNEWRGCLRYLIIEPGQVRPLDVTVHPWTQPNFMAYGGPEIEDFVLEWADGPDQLADSDDPDPEEEIAENPIGHSLRVTADEYDEMAADVAVMRESLTGDDSRITSLLHCMEESTRQMGNLCRSMINTYDDASLNVAYAANDSLLKLSATIGDLIDDSEMPAVVSRLHHYIHMKICFEMRSSIVEAIHDVGGQLKLQAG